MRKLSKNLFVLGLGIIFSFILGEFIIRIFYSQFSNYNIEMWRYASNLKQPLDLKNLPFHHFPNKEGYFYGVHIKTNSMGFRDYEYRLKKPKNTKRIVILGDSFTLGWGVPFEKIFSKRLESMLNEKYHVEVVNMGIGNYNTKMEVELFKLKGLKLKPDLLIIMYFLNDMESTLENLSSFDYFAKKRSYLYAFLFDIYIKLKSSSYKDFHWEQYYINLYSEKNISLNKESFKELFELYDEYMKILIVNIPELRSLNEYPFSFANEYIENVAREANVPFLDLLPILTPYDPKSLWVSNEDFHANSKANSIIAESIYEKIISEKLIE